jgi:hypothetical protein
LTVLGPTHAIPETLCPACHTAITAATAVGHAHEPVPGAVTLCAYCAVFLVYTEDAALRLLTNEEWLAGPPAWRERLTAVREAVLELHRAGITP